MAETSVEGTDAGSLEKALVEAALFAAGRPLSASEIAAAAGITADAGRSIASELSKEYRLRGAGVEIRCFEDSFVMQVVPSLVGKVAGFAPKELASPVLRTLAVVAYKQPIMQSVVIRIRGNKAYDHIHELEQLGLISASRKGRSKELKTTKGFADYFGLESDRPEFIRHALGVARKDAGITPMLESLGRRFGIDFVVVNPYKPTDDDIESLSTVEHLIISPGYSERVKGLFHGEIHEIGTRSLSQLKEDSENMARAVSAPGLEPFISEIDSLTASFRKRSAGAPAICPCSPMAKELAEDLRIPISDSGITVAADSSGVSASILLPTHQDYGIDIIERIKQRYEALLSGLGR